MVKMKVTLDRKIHEAEARVPAFHKEKLLSISLLERRLIAPPFLNLTPQLIFLWTPGQVQTQKKRHWKKQVWIRGKSWLRTWIKILILPLCDLGQPLWASVF
jgi:hypothetical protein